MKSEKWIALQIDFKADREINEIQDAEADVTFTHRESGEKLAVPAFWNGGCDWAVRVALNKEGVWDYELSSDGAISFDATGGEVECVPYTGEYEIYKRGFVKTVPNVRYFVYDDGTPFFYLGDTHWAMLKEEIDCAGDHAGNIQTDSHFKYIVDKRCEQKFTVYQSEPIGSKYKVNDGIDAQDVEDFKRVDRYFAYIAEKGLLHANAELIFPSEVEERYFTDKAFLRSITRYWVARYSAYPVVWTLGQEVDKAFFGKNGITPENNPYKDMCRYIYEFDAYKHPITAHQENAMLTGAAGGGKGGDFAWGNEERISSPSAFLGVEGHTWWGAQWRPEMHKQHSYSIPQDYWYNGEGKVTINYETRYDYLYTKNFGARANGWISFLSGMFGYGYGAADIWCYLSTYSFDKESSDGVDVVTGDEKKMVWGEAVLLPTGDQMAYMRDFFEKFDWWNLRPDFDEKNAVDCSSSEVFCTPAYKNNEIYTVYYYNLSEETSTVLKNMDGTYTAQWFDPENNTYTLISDSIVPQNGTWNVPKKTAGKDAVLFVTKNA